MACSGITVSHGTTVLVYDEVPISVPWMFIWLLKLAAIMVTKRTVVWSRISWVPSIFECLQGNNNNSKRSLLWIDIIEKLKSKFSCAGWSIRASLNSHSSQIVHVNIGTLIENNRPLKLWMRISVLVNTNETEHLGPLRHNESPLLMEVDWIPVSE